MKYLDVNNVFDLPEVENYLQHIFQLVLYDKGDNTQFYNCLITDDTYIHISIISEEGLIEPCDTLYNLLTQHNIGFIEYSIGSLEKAIEPIYYYRPFSDESEKVYQ